MCWQALQPFPCTNASPRLARQFCSDHLGRILGVGPQARDVIAQAELVTSELITNSVKARCSQLVLQLSVHRGWLQLGVEDDGDGTPALSHSDAHDDHGRGLRIVDAVADRWGITPVGDGKQVWAHLEVPAQLTATLTCSLSERRGSGATRP